MDNSTNFSETINRTLTDALNVPVNITRDLAIELGKEDPTPDELEMKLNNSISNNSKIFGVGVAYEPGVYKYLVEPGNISDPDLSDLYSPTYSRSNGEPELFQVSYNYTRPHVNGSDPHTEWYIRAMKDGKGWNEPYFGTRSKTYLMEYSMPIERNDTKIGVVFSSYSKEDLRKLFKEPNSTRYWLFLCCLGGKGPLSPRPRILQQGHQ